MSNVFKAIFPRPAPKARLSDVQERPSIVSEKAVADSTRVCDETGIFDQTKRLQESMDAGDIVAMAKVLRDDI